MGAAAALYWWSAAAAPEANLSATDSASLGSSLSEITVTAQRLELLGAASTASEGIVTDEEIQLLPAYRPGQLLETVPGLIVTLHSGEGKANQFLMRGYNLDHGTDLETYVDGMPINQPTHAHGQGYTDLNFMMPELADAMSYTKGPYYANVGDFGAVGSVRVDYRDTIQDQLSTTVGTLGYQRLFAAGSQSLGDGRVLTALEIQHYDGPFATPDDARKENFVLRGRRQQRLLDHGHGLSPAVDQHHGHPAARHRGRHCVQSIRHSRSHRRRARMARQPLRRRACPHR
jgi:outer membrane cobalamin receptor